MPTAKQKANNERLAAEIADAIAGAEFFSLTIYTNNGYRTAPLRTLELALEAAPLLEKETGNFRRAMIYAVSPTGRSVFVPRKYTPDMPTEPDDV